jgi:NAD(P)-dependent dehydrogenase (short-subunit alcohol dehydrogenase family)
MIPLRRLGTIDELAALVIALCSDAANYMTGSVIVIDGGYTIW